MAAPVGQGCVVGDSQPTVDLNGPVDDLLEQAGSEELFKRDLDPNYALAFTV
ncbi:MAG TPA: hypothetical protein VFI27_01830 [candidate division Zixibacteria bacterium]|nr:hypothetical protein [candidate division Zixibacteria bacterium]